QRHTHGIPIDESAERFGQLTPADDLGSGHLDPLGTAAALDDGGHDAFEVAAPERSQGVAPRRQRYHRKAPHHDQQLGDRIDAGPIDETRPDRRDRPSRRRQPVGHPVRRGRAARLDVHDAPRRTGGPQPALPRIVGNPPPEGGTTVPGDRAIDHHDNVRIRTGAGRTGSGTITGRPLEARPAVEVDLVSAGGEGRSQGNMEKRIAASEQYTQRRPPSQEINCMTNASRDVVVVGAGPNGLTAAAVLARAGLSVLVVERNERIGGSCRTEEVTLPGFRHDICSAIHPLGVVSPIFERLRLDRYGLEWLTAPLALAHPFDDGRTAVLSTDLERTRESLGRDGTAWLRLMKPFVERHRALFREILRPIRLPGHPLLLAAFGLHAIQSVERLARTFRDAPARALLAGSAAHSMLPLNAPGSASFGLVLSIAGHALDCPCARGGSQQIVDALAACARVDGCELRTGVEVRSLADLPPARVVLLDLTPRQFAALDGTGLTGRYRRALERFRYGPGVYKVDYALSDPIP